MSGNFIEFFGRITGLLHFLKKIEDTTSSSYIGPSEITEGEIEEEEQKVIDNYVGYTINSSPAMRDPAVKVTVSTNDIKKLITPKPTYPDIDGMIAKTITSITSSAEVINGKLIQGAGEKIQQITPYLPPGLESLKSYIDSLKLSVKINNYVCFINEPPLVDGDKEISLLFYKVIDKILILCVLFNVNRVLFDLLKDFFVPIIEKELVKEEFKKFITDISIKLNQIYNDPNNIIDARIYDFMKRYILLLALLINHKSVTHESVTEVSIDLSIFQSCFNPVFNLNKTLIKNIFDYSNLIYLILEMILCGGNPYQYILMKGLCDDTKNSIKIFNYEPILYKEEMYDSIYARRVGITNNPEITYEE